MSTSSQTISYPSSWQKPPFIENPLLRWGLIVGAASLLDPPPWAQWKLDIDRVMEGLPRGKRFLDAFFPAQFRR